MAGMQIRNRKAFYPVIYRRSSDVSYIKKKEFIEMQEEKSENRIHSSFSHPFHMKCMFVRAMCFVYIYG